MNEHRTMFRKKWKALCLLPFIGLLAGCNFNLFDGPSFDDDISSDHNVSRYLDELPYESHIGANKFGCYMDGELMASQGCFQVTHWILGHIDYVKGSLWYDFYGDWKYLYLSFLTERADVSMCFYSKPSVGMNTCKIRLGSNDGDAVGVVLDAQVEITCYDELWSIASGRFASIDIPLYDVDGNYVATACLTDGRFDVKYSSYKEWAIISPDV